VEIRLTLALPREELSVPAVRRVLAASMKALGVTEQTIADIEVALSEACTNVLDHAGGGSEYEVSAGIDGSMCVIEVIDRGPGFGSDGKGMADAATQAEGSPTGRPRAPWCTWRSSWSGTRARSWLSCPRPPPPCVARGARTRLH